MKRTAVKALRTARDAHLRRLFNKTTLSNNVSVSANARLRQAELSRQVLHHGSLRILSSSLYLRSFSFAAIVSLFASGFWYYQNDDTSNALNQTSVANLSSITRRSSSSQLLKTSDSPTPALASDALKSSGEDGTVNVEGTKEAPESKRALVVDAEHFYTHDIAPDAPLSKQSDDEGKQTLEMLTPEQATQKLRRNEESFHVGRGRGVVRYDMVQIASNNPIEDDHAERIVEVPRDVIPVNDGTLSNDWMFWGVFDGHSGWTTSAKLRQNLISSVMRELNSTYKTASVSSAAALPSPSAIDAAIRKGFTQLDREIVIESAERALKGNSKRAAAEMLAPALSGSCALLSFYDTQSKLFRVACTGDSRAVLGRRATSGKWTATPLSEDQTGDTPSEVARMRSEHPGEDGVIRNGRVLGGLQPTRAFGDSFYKWSHDIQVKIKTSYFGRTPTPLLKSPPYVTAEPIVTTTKVDPSRGDFVVLATDGLWEMLTNEEVVGLVGQWIENEKPASGGGSSWPSMSWFSGSKPSLNVENHPPPRVSADSDAEGQRAPHRQLQWDLKGADARFVVEDKNVATHLVRNALGGKDQDMLCALLTLPSPYSRRYRDDLTVQVVFFGDHPGQGDVTRNEEASAPIVEKSKL